MEQEKKKPLVIIPAYNEEKLLKDVLRRVHQQTDEFVVINDGSADKTADVASAAGAIVLDRGYNCGKGQSLRDGFDYALKHGYDAVIMLDANGQHAPEKIPEFIARYQEKSDKLIIGARNYKDIPLRRRIPNQIGKFLFSAAVGKDIPDNQSGFRLVDEELMREMLNTKESGFQFEVEMIALCIAKNWEIGWISIPTIYGEEKSKQKAVDQIFGFPVICWKARQLIKKERAKSAQ